MSDVSKIEWTDSTHNEWEGCEKVGPGCDNCYAEARNARFAGGEAVNWGPGAPRRLTSAANRRKPYQWQAKAAAFFAEHGRRRRVFCSSLSDVFDKAVPDEWRVGLFRTIAETPDLDWLLLTKRIGNAWRMSQEAMGMIGSVIQKPLPPNIWLGATIVNQKEANRDIPKLLAIPARVRFLSMEPLLGPVTIFSKGDPHPLQTPRGVQLPPGGLHWVIVGGESGPNARPMHPDWARSLRDQCAESGVPLLYKQWGEWVPRGPESMGYPLIDGVPRIRLTDAGHNGQDLGAKGGNDCWMQRAGKKTAGRLLDGVEFNGFPKVSAP